MSDIEDGFLVQLPVFTVADPRLEKAHGLIRALPVVECKPYGVFFPFFTDHDLAQTFIEELPLPGKVVAKLLNHRGVRVALEAIQQHGCNYVGIDVSLRPTMRGRFAPISEIIDAFRNAEDRA